MSAHGSESGAARGGGAPSQHAAFPFRYDDAVSARVAAEFRDGLKRADPQRGEALAADYAQRDHVREFEVAMRDYPLYGDDVADAMTGYWVTLWCIIHDRPFPPAGPVRAAREQIKAMLAKNPVVLQGGDARRQMMAEAMILETLFALDQAAALRNDDTPEQREQFVEAARNNMLSRGVDLAHLTLGARGFQPLRRH